MFCCFCLLPFRSINVAIRTCSVLVPWFVPRQLRACTYRYISIYIRPYVYNLFLVFASLFCRVSAPPPHLCSSSRLYLVYLPRTFRILPFAFPCHANTTATGWADMVCMCVLYKPYVPYAYSVSLALPCCAAHARAVSISLLPNACRQSIVPCPLLSFNVFTHFIVNDLHPPSFLLSFLPFFLLLLFPFLINSASSLLSPSSHPSRHPCCCRCSKQP